MPVSSSFQNNIIEHQNYVTSGPIDVRMENLKARRLVRLPQKGCVLSAHFIINEACLRPYVSSGLSGSVS